MNKKINRTPIDLLITPIQHFIRQEKSAGIVLAVSVVAAMLLANSFWSEHFFGLFENTLGFIINGKSYLDFSVRHWINDGLMSMFFFVIGLELKRELIAGELSSVRKALLPAGAALGGMLVPAAIYLVLNPSAEVNHGWGIPMATDIVFALGVLSLLGNKVPLSLKVFLMALAIVDDLASVLVIAFFYTSDISAHNLIIGGGFVVAIFIGNRIGIKNIFFYAIFGIGGLWLAFLLSGVHATIAAVIAAFLIPADAKIDEGCYIERIKHFIKRLGEIKPNGKPTLSNDQVEIFERIKDSTKAALPPLQRLEKAMHPMVSFVIVPLFVLANAGVSFSGMRLSDISSSNVTAGVALGLLLGKVTGVVGFTALMLKLKIAAPSKGMDMRNLVGIGLVASIGFTMSLFITSLAFSLPIYAVQAKIGIFAASIIGGTLGYIVLNRRTTVM